jgi:HTH-type transcriptional regulator, competence development regulator
MGTKSDKADNPLGDYLATIRAAKELSLRDVEEATNKEVSNAYLSQLENGKISRPSPHILHSLAEVYGVPYETLMEKAGYIQKSRAAQEHHGVLPTFASENLTSDEERALLEYLKVYRNLKRKHESRR